MEARVEHKVRSKFDSAESADGNSGLGSPLRDVTGVTWGETDRLPGWGAGGGSWQYDESRINWRRLGGW